MDFGSTGKMWMRDPACISGSYIYSVRLSQIEILSVFY
jgi:hypothetical protein